MSKLLSSCQTWIRLAELFTLVTIFDFIFSLLVSPWHSLSLNVLGHKKQDSSLLGENGGMQAVQALKTKLRRMLIGFLVVKLALVTQRTLVKAPSFPAANVSNHVEGLFNNKTQTFTILDNNDVKILGEPRLVCAGHHRAFLMVPSAPANEWSREKMRAEFNQTEEVFLVFLLGNTRNGDVEERIGREGDEYGDILETSVIESYENVVYKILMGFLWANLHCRNVKYIVKIDDNVELDFGSVMAALDDKFGVNTVHEDSPPHVIQCPAVIRNMRPWRHQHRGTILGKWSVSESAMPHTVFPDFCLGWLYVTTPSTALHLVQAARELQLVKAPTDEDMAGGPDSKDITDAKEEAMIGGVDWKDITDAKDEAMAGNMDWKDITDDKNEDMDGGADWKDVTDDKDEAMAGGADWKDITDATDEDMAGGVDWKDITDDIFVTGFLREHLPGVSIGQLDSSLVQRIPCPFFSVTANIFHNRFVVSKTSGDVSLVGGDGGLGGLHFYGCIVLELFVLDTLEQLAPSLTPQFLWDICSR